MRSATELVEGLPEHEAERAIQSEIARLSPLQNVLRREMTLVSRREAIKDRLRAIENEIARAKGTRAGGSLLAALLTLRERAPRAATNARPQISVTEKASLNVELRRVTAQAQAAVAAWCATHSEPFVFRGVDYRDVLALEKDPRAQPPA